MMQDVYKEFWAAYDVPRHLYHFSPASMKTLLEKHGMKVEKMKPMWYDSVYVSMLSEQYKTGQIQSCKRICYRRCIKFESIKRYRQMQFCYLYSVG